MGLGLDLALVALQWLPAVVISAGVNFAVAYAMYHTQRNINFFPFPNTIAGDLAVTNFIQGCLNYLFPNVTTELDNRLGKRLPWRRVINPPLGLVARVANLDGKKQQFWQTFVQSQDILQPKLTPKTLFKRLFFCILRGLFLSVFLFLLTWSIAVAIACPIYCGKNIGSTWAPQAIKALYGGVHALVEIPIAQFLILLSIDVRNHDTSLLPSSNKGGRNDYRGFSASSHVGHVVNSDTQRLVAIDTRTNQPIAEEHVGTMNDGSSTATPSELQHRSEASSAHAPGPHM